MTKEGMIGLEIHVYPNTKEKLFCRCKASREKGAEPNSNICAVCAGQPGAKPMLPNGSAVGIAVKVGLMLGCTINDEMVWQRKHYSWPDLPKGYQNTISGTHAIPVGIGGKFFGIGITEMHLEEDPASWDPETGRVDYNRSGLPLLEIVTEPDFSTSEEVIDWLKKLLHNLQYLKAVQGDAGIKVDVNVSLPKKTERVEIKNVNSLFEIERAIEYELERQGEEGGKVKETRRWDGGAGETVVMRGKEGAADYRFISDPDLVHMTLDTKFISGLEGELPESPEEKLSKLVKKYKIGKREAGVLAKNLEIVEFFERVADKVGAKFALDWVIIELLSVLNYNKKTLAEVDIRLEHFVELLDYIKKETITVAQGRQILREFSSGSYSVKEKGVEGKVGDVSELSKVVKEVIGEEADAVGKYRAGDKKVLNYLVGQVMKKTKGRADFKVVREILEKELG